MRRTIGEAAIGVGAGALVLVLTILVSDLPVWVQVGISVGVGLAAFAVGHRAFGKAPARSVSSVDVGTRIDAKGAVSISDVDTGEGSEQTSIGTDISSGRDVTIKGVRVNREREEK